jgi:hypothetical protein
MMSPLSALIHYMDLKHFVSWIVVPLVAAATQWGLRKLVGADHLDGKSSCPPKLFTAHQPFIKIVKPQFC